VLTASVVCYLSKSNAAIILLRRPCSPSFPGLFRVFSAALIRASMIFGVDICKNSPIINL